MTGSTARPWTGRWPAVCSRGSSSTPATRPYERELRERILAALPPNPTDMAEVCRLDTLIGQAFADAAEECGPVDLVCSHGQTLFHWVENGRVRGTLQLGQPAWIAERTGAPVVSDLRVRDVSAGGQGAPLVSYFDLLLLAGLPGASGALNLGGIANLTVRDLGIAYDTGPASALMDAAVSAATGGSFDETAVSPRRGRSTKGCCATCWRSRTIASSRRRPPARSCSTRATWPGWPHRTDWPCPICWRR